MHSQAVLRRHVAPATAKLTPPRLSLLPPAFRRLHSGFSCGNVIVKTGNTANVSLILESPHHDLTSRVDVRCLGTGSNWIWATMTPRHSTLADRSLTHLPQMVDKVQPISHHGPSSIQNCDRANLERTARNPNHSVLEGIHLAVSLLAALSVAAVCGCDSRSAAASSPKEPQAAAAPLSAVRLVPYPPGRWRLISPTALSEVTLWVSHLLIRHEGVEGTQVCLGPPGWYAFPPPPSRTRDEALSLATDIANRIGKSSQTFAEAAAAYSEDTVTRGTQGSLGGVAASELVRTPEILDALAEMGPDEISRVVETHCGFHILHRRSVPPDTTVSGSRIVIGHDGVPWLRRFGARRIIPSRSRDQALALATQVYERAQASPELFADLVRVYSDHRDALDEGELGQWSTHETSPIPRELELLARLHDGEIAPPIEGLFGFEILRRTPNRPRKQFAMEALRVYFDAEASERDPMSRIGAWNTMTEAIKTLTSNPSLWPQLYATYNTEDIGTWTEGRAPRELEAMLGSLNVGDIANRPVEWNSSFLVAKAVAPIGVSLPQDRLYELPSPVEPDVGYLARRTPVAAMRRVILATIKEISSTQELSIEQEGFIEALAPTDQCSEAASATDPSSPSFIHLQQQLGDELFALFQRTFARHLEYETLAMAKVLRSRPVN
jgi:PPIC-type peptidyl-prolyl cis-trans isomerase-like protein